MNMRTDNMMRIYLGDEYTGDSLINFCRYWIKGIRIYDSYATYDEWRVENDLDCLYYDGNLKADTLMSAWTPIKWVADCINRSSGKRFWKPNERNGYDLSDLELLVADREKYLPADNEMVMLLDTFLELAEEPCNYILLPDRDMNCKRYTFSQEPLIQFFDEVPATLYNLWEKEFFGSFFAKKDGSVDTEAVVKWITDQQLQDGFRSGVIAQQEVLPLIPGLHPSQGKWLYDEKEIKAAIYYMVRLLSQRKQRLEAVVK